MVRDLHTKTASGIEGLQKLEADTEKEVNDIESLRQKDFQNELDAGFFFSVVFDTRSERDSWLKEHGIKLQEDFFVKAKDFRI